MCALQLTCVARNAPPVGAQKQGGLRQGRLRLGGPGLRTSDPLPAGRHTANRRHECDDPDPA
jgi:hypothetical protein